MRFCSKEFLSVVLLGMMLQSAEALASRIHPRCRQSPLPLTPHQRISSFSSRPSFVTTRQLTPQPEQDRTTSTSIRKSPLFSANPAAVTTTTASTAAAAATAAAKVAVPLKKRLWSLRGGAGAAGVAASSFIKNILDDVAASKTKSWAVLVCSILLETCASTLSKRARDTANPGLFAFAVSLNLISLCGFCTCLAKLDVGVAYAVWAALGTVIVTTAGIFFFNEAMDPIKLVSILLVIVGVVGLNLTDSH